MEARQFVERKLVPLSEDFRRFFEPRHYARKVHIRYIITNKNWANELKDIFLRDKLYPVDMRIIPHIDGRNLKSELRLDITCLPIKSEHTVGDFKLCRLLNKERREKFLLDKRY